MDRKVNLRVVDGSKSSSLSARRAWIEKWVLRKVPILGIVALRKESVDRKGYIQAGTGILNCRSPQGERG